MSNENKLLEKTKSKLKTENAEHKANIEKLEKLCGVKKKKWVYIYFYII